MKQARQISESVILGVLLALSGGFMDAYSYMCRDGVFANAQTGNILLLGVHLAQRNWANALRYACPVLAFVLGIVLADLARLRFKSDKALHWRQFAVAFEIAVLFLVGFLSQNANLLANSLISLACGIQVEAFRKIGGNSIATTMCIGNLRSATQAFCMFLHTKEKIHARTGGLFFGIIGCFVIGAVMGDWLVRQWAEYAVWFCCAVLLAVFFLMFIDREKTSAALPVDDMT